MCNMHTIEYTAVSVTQCDARVHGWCVRKIRVKFLHTVGSRETLYIKIFNTPVNGCLHLLHSPFRRKHS